MSKTQIGSGRTLSLTIIFLFLFANQIKPQVLSSEWVVTSGAKGWDIVNGIACDTKGNIYITGSITDTLLNKKSDKVSTKTKTFLFLSKYDTSGKLIWNKKVGSYEPGYGGLICVTKNNQIILAGAEIVDNKNKKSGKENTRFFISSMDTNGITTWAEHFTGNQFTFLTSLLVDSISGNIIIGGYYYDTLSIGKSSMISKGKSDGMLLSYNPDGKFLKSISIGTKLEESICSISGDKQDNHYVTGIFQGKLQIDNQRFEVPTNGQQGVFVVKYDSAGTCISANVSCFGKNIKVSSTCHDGKKLIIAGSFSDILTIKEKRISSSGSDDIFVLCLDSELNMNWFKHFEGEKKDRAGSLKLSRNELILTGSFNSKLRIENVSLTSANNSTDVFVLSLDTTGKLNWVRKFGGDYEDYPRCLDNGTNGYLYVSGSYRHSIKNLKILTAKGEEDIFIARLENCSLRAPKFKKPETYCNGNSLTLDAGNGFSSYNWNNGFCLDQQFTVKKPGDYSLELHKENGCIIFDTIRVLEIPAPDAFIGDDTTITDTSVLVLKTKKGFAKYLWSTGSVESSISIRGFNCHDGDNLFWVQVQSIDSCSGFAQIHVNKAKTLPVSISDKLSNSCIIYPNPATEKITVYFTIPLEQLELRLIDINGKELNSKILPEYKKFEKLVFNIEPYPSGLITISIKTKDGLITKKIIHE